MKLGGSGGGGGSSPTITKDNLRSQDSVEFILGLCEGPIAGLIDGPESFFLDDTPLQSKSGENNFDSFEVHVYHGSDTPTRIVPAFGGTANNVAVNVPLAQYVQVNRTTDQALRGQIDRIEMRIAVNQLLLTTDKGDQYEETARFKMAYKKDTDTIWSDFTGNSMGFSLVYTETTTHTGGEHGGGNTTTRTTTSTQNKGSSGNLFSLRLFGLAAPKEELSLVGSVAQTLSAATAGSLGVNYSGPLTFNRKKVGVYGTLWVNTTNKNYFYQVTSASTTEVIENFVMSGQDSAQDSSYSLTFKVTNPEPSLVKITGKTDSGYIKEYVLRIPEADRSYMGDWNLRVEKLNPDNDNYSFVGLTWESFQCVSTDSDLQFERLAVMRGLGTSSNQFSSLPALSGIYAGRIIMVPNNYDTLTRTYTGSWLGGFQLGYTDNPAWCLYDLIMNTDYGVKKHLPRMQCDKWSFYAAAQWCDVMVARYGSTGFQPRYTYNDYIESQRQGLENCQYIASTFGAFLCSDLNGTLRLKIDQPGPPLQIFGPENTAYEGFQYQFADVASRANDFTVSFVNPELDWAEDVRSVSDPDLITKNGRIPMDFVAVGCIDAYEAQRRAKLRLIAANTEITTVTFATTRLGMRLEIYDIIGVSDPHMNWGLSGRIKSVSGDQIYLRDALYTPVGVDMTMDVQGRTGVQTLIVRNDIGPMSSQLTIQTGSLTGSLPDVPQFVLSSTSIGLIKPFRVLMVTPDDAVQDMFSITAIELNVSKQTDADTMVTTPPKAYSFENTLFPPTPSTIRCESGTTQLYVVADGGVRSRIRVTWQQDPAAFVSEHNVFYRRIDQDGFSKVSAQGSDAYIENVQDGTVYQIYVKAVNAMGRSSPASATISHTAVGKLAPPSTVTGLTLTQVEGDMWVKWTAVSDLDVQLYEIREGGTTWETAIKIGLVSGEQFIHRQPSKKSLIYWVKAKDTTGGYSSAATPVSGVIAAPGMPSLNMVFSGTDYVAAYTPATVSGAPVKEYVLKINGVEVSRGAQTSFKAKVNWVGLKTFTLTAVNTAGVSSVADTKTLVVNSPPAPTLVGTFGTSRYTLAWNSVAGSLPVDHYVVRNKTDNQVLDGGLRANTYVVLSSWVGGREFEVWAVDSAGNVGGSAFLVGAVTLPGVFNLTSKLLKGMIELQWQVAPGVLPIKQFHVYAGSTIATIKIATVNALNYSRPVDYFGTQFYHVVAEDVMGNLSIAAVVVETVDPPEAPSVTGSLIDSSIRLDWVEPISELRIRDYEIRVGSTLIQKVTATTALLPINFTGNRTYLVAAVDEAGNVGTPSSYTTSIVTPGIFLLSASIVARSVVLTWTTPASTLPIQRYVVTRGAANTPVVSLSANSFTMHVDWVDLMEFQVTAYDTAGNASPVQTKALDVNAPLAPVVRPEVLDNNVMLRWTNVPGTLPLVSTEIRKGAVFASAEVLHKADATFAVFFEFISGVFTYWAVGIDSAGNYGVPTQVKVQVAQPPDFVLQTSFDSLFGGTLTNAALIEGSVYFGVSTSETYQTHFTTVGSTTPQDQINSGYPLWLQPTAVATTGSYQEVFDYGLVLVSSLISVTVNSTIVSGNPTLATDIEVRKLSTDAWTMIGVGVLQALGSDFRYVRFTVRMLKDDRADLVSVSKINVRLNTKLRADAGSGAAVSTDAGGTQVNFDYDFVDVSAITITPLSTTFVVAVYDFVDTPYPTGFKVLLFNSAGTRVSGSFSWTARGF